MAGTDFARRPLRPAAGEERNGRALPWHHVLRAEWIKARSVPETWLMAGAALLVGTLWAVIPGLALRRRLEETAAAGESVTVGPLMWLGLTRIAIVVIILLGAVLVAGDRQAGTHLVTRMLCPRPLKVYSAKAVIAALAGLVVGFAIGVLVPLLLRVIFGPVIAAVTTAGFAWFGFGLRAGLICAVCAVLGVALGALTRSLLLTAVIGFVWVWFENLAASMFGEFGNFGVLTPWRNLSYFLDGSGFGLPFLWSSHWGLMPLLVLTVALGIAGALRHHHNDAETTKDS